VIVQFGGQTPLKLALELEAAGVPIIGTTPTMIDVAEDREHFQKMLHQLDLLQPENGTARTTDQALTLAKTIGYPLVVRPSYVLGGRAMQIVHHENELTHYMQTAVQVSPSNPVLLDRFLSEAMEVDVDALCDGKAVVIAGVMQHIEQAGVHSGDSACVLPPHSIPEFLLEEIRSQTRKMAMALKVVGLMNVQFAIKGELVYVLEVNPRASRTVPFVAKATGKPIAAIAARCMAGISLAEQGITEIVTPTMVSVKEVVFPFNKFPGVDMILGPEMKSTGEVMGLANSFAEAFLKAQIGSGVKLPRSGKVFMSLRDADKPKMVDSIKNLINQGFSVVATRGTAAYYRDCGLAVGEVNKVAEGRPHIVDMMKNGEIALVFNTVDDKPATVADSQSIRITSLAKNIPIFTTAEGAIATCEAIAHRDSLTVNALQSL
jgi:carbamoyl-phosphate synthase large subunit